MYITNIDEVIPALRTRLNDYLVEMDIKTPEQKQFRCFMHDDHDPSMAMNPKTNWETAHCFTCSKSIDVFSAAAFLEGLPEGGSEWITETVPTLARKLDVSIQVGEASARDKQKLKLYRLAQDIADIVESPENVNANYLEERNWENPYETYGSIDSDRLISQLVEKGWSPQDINKSRMIRTKTKEFFGKDMLTFPVRDYRGRPIAFVSRNLQPSDHEPKYINTPENLIYDKSKTLIGLDKAIKNARTDGLYLVEGPGDRAQFLRLGVTNVAAASGTAVTPQHLTQLKMLGIKDVYFCFDWDDGGKINTARIFTNVLKEAPGVNCWVIEEPDDLPGDVSDPDDFLRDLDDFEPFQALELSSAFEWLVKNQSDNDTPADICTQLVPIIAAEPTAVRREMLIQQLSDTTGISYHAIRSDVSSIRNKTQEERRERILAAADSYRLELERSPDDAYALLSQHETDIQNIEKDYEQDIIGVNYQLSRFDSVQEMKIPSSDGVDRTGFELKYFPEFAEKFSHGQPWSVGTLVYFGGRPNAGKSATCILVGLDVLINDPDTIVLMHFTDDNYMKAESRLKTNLGVIAGIGPRDYRLPIGAAANPHFNIENDTQQQVYNDINTLMRDYIAEEKLVILDSTDGASLSTLERTMRYLRHKYPKKKMMAICDNTHNYIDWDHLDQTRRIQKICNKQKTLTAKYKLCMLATAEYRKNQPLDKSKIKWPTNDDLADSRSIMYVADAIIHVYNDLKDRDEHAEFFWPKGADYEDRNPRILLRYGKNKISRFDKTLYLDMHKDSVTMEPISVHQAKNELLGIESESMQATSTGVTIDATDLQ